MPKITFTDRDLTLEAQPNETLLSCIRRAGLSVDSTCNGDGKCGKCRVTATGGLTPPDEKERKLLRGRPPGMRLACLTKVTGDARIALSDQWTQLKAVLGQSDWKGTLDSPVRRAPLPETGEIDGTRPYVEGLAFRVESPEVLNAVALWDACGETAASGVTFDEELLDVRRDATPLLGASVDVGTTSLSLCLYDLESGKMLGAGSALNPQTAYGGDVITRIGYCRKEEEGLSRLRAAVVKAVNEMLDEALHSHGASRDQVYLMTIAANSTMLHIIAGVQPLSLALSPFRPIFLRRLTLQGAPAGLPIHPRGRCLLLPGASAYVGADIVAGLISVDYRSRPGTFLFIDIGTNGEIVLVEDSGARMTATSCAMGPALEGMNIACGCRAVPGAVSSFSLDGDLLPRFTTIDDQAPIGVCGSGLVDVVAALLDAGLIAPGGAFNRKADPRLLARLREDRYFIADGVFLSQKDVRQVQLARGALLTGVMVLLKETGHSPRDLDEIIVAGSFGYHLKADSLRAIGFIPEESAAPITYVGNSSLAGATAALLDRKCLKEMEDAAESVRVLELGAHPDFRSNFMSNLRFPVRA